MMAYRRADTHNTHAQDAPELRRPKAESAPLKSHSRSNLAASSRITWYVSSNPCILTAHQVSIPHATSNTSNERFEQRSNGQNELCCRTRAFQKLSPPNCFHTLNTQNYTYSQETNAIDSWKVREQPERSTVRLRRTYAKIVTRWFTSCAQRYFSHEPTNSHPTEP